MASKKITAMPNWAGGQISTDLVTGVDLSQSAANQNVKSTLNDLFSIITKNITDGAVRYAGTFTPAVSAANAGAFFYNDVTDTFQGSRNTSIYENLLFGNGTNHFVAFFGSVVDRIEGDAGFQYFAAASPNARIVQKAVNDIALQVTSLENVDSTSPLSKWISADGNARVTITPSSTQFATDTVSMITVVNTNAAGSGRTATVGIIDTVSANLPFYSVLNNFGSEFLMAVNGTTRAGTNTRNVANSCLLQSCCPEGTFYVADDSGRQFQYFVTGGFAFTDICLTIDSEHNVVMGNAALSTGATNGFFYMNACAGIPTANPNATITPSFWNRTGRVPTNYDSTNATAYAFLGSSWLAMSRLRSRVSTQFDKANNTLANITGLTLNVAAGKTYAFEAILYTTSDVTAGVKFAIGGTATATAIVYEAVDYQGGLSVATGTQRAAALGTAVGDVTTVTTAYVRITGTITVNAAGTLTAQFAQNATNASVSSVLVGSVFIADQIL